MSSVNGRHALPSFSPYNASKYAVETVSDSLRMEMQRFGVKVILIEPGMFGGSTEIHSEANVITYFTLFLLRLIRVCVEILWPTEH